MTDVQKTENNPFAKSQQDIQESAERFLNMTPEEKMRCAEAKAIRAQLSARHRKTS
jgi:hypothetical protein